MVVLCQEILPFSGVTQDDAGEDQSDDHAQRASRISAFRGEDAISCDIISITVLTKLFALPTSQRTSSPGHVLISYSLNLNMLISAIYRVTRQSCWRRYGDCHRAHRPSRLPSLNHPSTFVPSAPTVGPTLVCESSLGMESPPEKPLATPLHVSLLGRLSVSFASIVTAWASYLPPIANMAGWAWKLRCLLYSVLRQDIFF